MNISGLKLKVEVPRINNEVDAPISP